MAVRILTEDSGARACMYCSTTDWAFGPVVDCDDEHYADDRLKLFINWLVVDPRALTDRHLESKYNEFLSVEKELWAKYEAEQSKLIYEDEESSKE